MYYADGYIYTNTMGEKTKTVNSIDTLEQFNNTLINIKNFEDIKVIKKDGITTLEFKMNNDQLNQILEESMNGALGLGSLKYTDANIIVTVNSDNMTNDMVVSLATIMNDGATETNFNINITMSYAEYKTAKVT